MKTLLWGLLGPLLVACALIVVAFRGPIAWELSLLGIAGIYFCYQWHWRGMFLGCALLAGALAFRLGVLSSSEWLWMTVLCFSFVSAFVVAVLSMEESGVLWNALTKEVEDQKALAMIWHERAQNVQAKGQAEQQSLQNTIDQLTQALQEEQRRQRNQNNEVLVRMEGLSREKNLLELALNQHKAQLESLQAECQAALQSKERDSHTLEQLSKLHAELKTSLDEEESPPDDRELRRMQGLYEQLREQFAEKSTILDDTRKQLFLAQEKLSSAERKATEQEEVETQTLMRMLALAEEEFTRQERAYQQEIVALQAILNERMKAEG